MFIKYTTRKRNLSFALAMLLLFSAFPVKTEAAEDSIHDRIIVSVGDSYSSGEGIEPFYGQDQALSVKVKDEDWLAHRSESSWPGMLTLPGVSGTMADNRNTHWFFAASSGATTKHLEKKQPKSYSKSESLIGHLTAEATFSGTGYVSPQINIFDELGNRKADYVTLTLGGNDADFTGVIESVVTGSTYLNISGLSDKLNSTWDAFYKKDGIRDKLRSSYKKIAKTAGAQAHIIVAGYPQLLDDNGKGVAVSKEEAHLVNNAVNRFNYEIEQLVGECSKSGMNISFVSVVEAFKGHEAYSNDPYINEIRFGPILQPQDLKDFGTGSSYSIHPNYQGACAYARCVQQEIDRLERERFFNETCWVWNQGVTAGSSYAVLFHLDGTLNYYNMNDGLIGSTDYQYENSILNIDGVEYVWKDGQFVSFKKFADNGSAKAENYILYPDDQERFYQLASFFTGYNFVGKLQNKYGIASYTEFISCIGEWLQQYPASIDGFITDLKIDLNNDETLERIVLISKNQRIYLQVYHEISGMYVLSCEECITSLDHFSQQNISLFYNNDINGYVLFVDRNSTGSYTGIDGYHASLFSVTPSHIELLKSINEATYDTRKEDIPAILQSYRVPYAENCAKIDNITLDSGYVALLEIEHQYFDTDPTGDWRGREHHLQLLTPEYLEKPDEPVQTWIITRQSYQGFTEYREETHTYYLESGKIYQVSPKWSDGAETGYTVLNYSVDTKERTITIFMDYPQGSEHWKGLILDLKRDTYYGLDFTTFYP